MSGLMILLFAAVSTIVFIRLWKNTANRPNFLAYMFFAFCLWCMMVMTALIVDTQFGSKLAETAVTKDYREVAIMTITFGVAVIGVIHATAVMLAHDVPNWAKVKFFGF